MSFWITIVIFLQLLRPAQTNDLPYPGTLLTEPKPGTGPHSAGTIGPMKHEAFYRVTDWRFRILTHLLVMATNGVTHRTSRPLKSGIYAPIPTFFLPDSEDLGKSRNSFTFLVANGHRHSVFRGPCCPCCLCRSWPTSLWIHGGSTALDSI